MLDTIEITTTHKYKIGDYISLKNGLATIVEINQHDKYSNVQVLRVIMHTDKPI